MATSHSLTTDWRLIPTLGNFSITDCAVAGAGLSGVAAFVSLRCHAANSGGFSTAEPGPAWQPGSLAAGNLAQLRVHHWLLISVPGHQGGARVRIQTQI